jgi:hypothetical protein
VIGVPVAVPGLPFRPALQILGVNISKGFPNLFDDFKAFRTELIHALEPL